MSRWSEESWLRDVRDWVRHEAQGAGMPVTDDGQQVHDRPWSTAIVFQTSAGQVWFKANGSGTAHEPALLATLDRLRPGLAAEVLAVDTTLGFSLTRDAGPTLRTAVPLEDRWAAWEQIMADYADAQLALSSHCAELCAGGLADRSPGTLPGLLADLVEELSSSSPAEGGLTAEERTAYEATYPQFDGWCAELAASGIPSSIQHDDLHSGNVCWPGSAATARVIDWGDASVMHPFGTLLVTMNAVAADAEVEPTDPRVERVRDAYLDRFAAYGGRDELVALAGLAVRTGPVARALSWKSALADVPPQIHRDWDFPVRSWLAELTASGPA